MLCCAKLLQSSLTLYDPMNYSLPGSSVHGILQARILEWVTISFSRGIFSTQGLNLCLLCCRRIIYHHVTGEAPTHTQIYIYIYKCVYIYIYIYNMHIIYKCIYICTKLCNHQQNSVLEHFHHTKKIPHAHFQSNSCIYLHSQAITTILSVPMA